MHRDLPRSCTEPGQREQRSCQEMSCRELEQRPFQRFLAEILQGISLRHMNRDLVHRSVTEISDRNPPQKSQQREPTQDLLHRTGYTYPCKGILHSSFYRDPGREIVHTTFYSSHRQVPEATMVFLRGAPPMAASITSSGSVRPALT